MGLCTTALLGLVMDFLVLVVAGVELLGVGGGGAREILRLFIGLLGLLLVLVEVVAEFAGTFLTAVSEEEASATSLGVFKTFISTWAGLLAVDVYFLKKFPAVVVKLDATFSDSDFLLVVPG